MPPALFGATVLTYAGHAALSSDHFKTYHGITVACLCTVQNDRMNVLCVCVLFGSKGGSAECSQLLRGDHRLRSGRHVA